jgi:DNA-binding beta-propeller fold protein YncE
MARTTIRCLIEAAVLALLAAWTGVAQPLTFEYVLTLGAQEGVNPHQRFNSRLGKLIFGKPEHVSPVMVPDSLTVDPDQRVWLTDRAAAGVHMFNLIDGKYKFLRGGGGLNFQCPAGIDSDSEGLIYVVDTCLAWVFVFYKDASFNRFLKTGTALKKPVGLAVSRNRKTIYISDAGRQKILVLNQEGEQVSEWGGPNTFSYPATLTLGDKKLYVYDANRRQVRAFSIRGEDLGPLRWDRVKNSTSFGYDAERGLVFLGESMYGMVLVYDEDGNMVGAFGPNGTGTGEIQGAAGLYVDSWHRVYVIDTQNAKVVLFRQVGEGVPDLIPRAPK